MTTKYSTCPLCEANCGIEIQVENNQILEITGDKLDPISQGYTCPKAFALKELHSDPDRLRKPMIREGEKWRETSWEEALDVAEKGIRRVQKKHGKDAVGIFQGNPLGHSADGVLFYWLLTKVLKTRNVFSSASLDQLPHMVVADSLYGNLGMFTIPDVDRTNFMVIMGANPLVSNGSIMTAPNIMKRLRDVQRKGGKVVVIDPRRTETAKFANEHIAIQPGTDAYLLLAILHVLFRDELVRLGKLESIIEGVEEIRTICSKYSPEFVSGITTISSDVIETLSRDFAQSESSIFYTRVGASMQEFGTLTHWLAHLINILTGNLDKEGGMMFTKPPIDFVKAARFFGESGNYGQYKSRVNGYPSFRGEFPTAGLIDEIITPGTGQIKGMVTVAGNPVLSAPNGRVLEKALNSLDFMVSVDIYINETTRFADVILPPRFSLETARFELVFPVMSVRNKIKYSPPVLERSKESRSDAEILRELASRLAPALSPAYFFAKLPFTRFLLDFMIRTGNYGDRYWPFSSGLNLRKVKQQTHGIDLGPLVPVLPGRLFTKNKKINLADSLIMKDLERLSARKAELDRGMRKEDEFLLIGKRDLLSNNSWFHNLKPQSADKLECKLLMHPEDARKLGIEDAMEVVVSSEVNQIKVVVKTTKDMKSGVVSLPHGWGHGRKGTRLIRASENPGVCINDLIDHKKIDKLSGTSMLNGVKVKISKQ